MRIQKVAAALVVLVAAAHSIRYNPQGHPNQHNTVDDAIWGYFQRTRSGIAKVIFVSGHELEKQQLVNAVVPISRRDSCLVPLSVRSARWDCEAVCAVAIVPCASCPRGSPMRADAL
jgi:hypothetical protein